jgi:signal transduction histidine kinase
MGAVRPLLVQDGSRSDAYSDLPAVQMGFTRYLGVPIFTPGGAVIGTLCFLDTHSESPLSDADVQFVSLLAMRISAEMERERAIEERLAEQKAMVARLAEANAKLLATAEEKRRFMATVIHDMRQPLTAMRTTLYLLRETVADPEDAESVAMLEERVTAMNLMVEELLQYAEIESGRVRWRLEPVNVDALLSECVSTIAPTLAEKGLGLTFDVAPDLGAVQADRGKLAHIVGNLLSNAVKFTAAGSVAIRARCDGPDWRMEVEDTGVGIPPECLERIFEEFFQAPPPMTTGTARIAPGRGLGLAIVRHLCNAMGATVSVTSEPGRGTCFRLCFPREPRVGYETPAGDA